MNKKEVKFTVYIEHLPKLLKDIGELMSKLDLGITGIAPEISCYNISYNTTSKITKPYLKKIVKAIIKSFTEDGIKVKSIQHLTEKGNKSISEEFIKKV